MSYVELHARSAFSFLRGSSQPEHIAEAAAQLEMPAMALCDRDGVYGAPRFFGKAKESGLRPIVGAELTMEDGSILPVLVENRAGYQNLCRLLTRAHLRSEKGKSKVGWAELPEFKEGLVALTGDEDGPLVSSIRNEQGNEAHSAIQGQSLLTSAATSLERLLGTFGRDHVFVEIQRHHLRGEERVNSALVQLADNYNLPLLATNGVLHATPSGRQVLDVFTCIRHHTHLDNAGKLLAQNSERFLKNEKQMRELFRDLPQAIENTSRLAERLHFSLDNLGYEFPQYAVPAGHNADSFLREQSFAGARKRYQGEVPEKVRGQLESELALIQKLGVSGYFLIVWDIVEFCREQNIMSQGRGSAANSSVCYCLGITNVDPLKFHTLFERFLSEGRKNSWPDIDIDLPSGDRRERVIQEVYKRYGKHGAAMTANVITYRGRSAAREIGKALNIAPDVLDRFSNLFANGDFPHTLNFTAQMEKAGLPDGHPRALAFTTLYQQMRALPRHLGQHSGGMIICQGKLDSVMPLENASMPGRVVAQWDKDDCEELGIIKVDFLGLGMMSVIQDSVELTRQLGRPIDLAHLPENDAKTFEMICAADTIGVFQIESRAQMATLPRMKPETFYDLCIEVAIIRPGPIQGGLMHPYLRRRAGKEEVTYYHPDLEPVLKRTLGIPLFQEQMLEMAMKMTDFTASEAEELRRALSFHRSEEKMIKVEKKLRDALQRKGYTPKVIEDVATAVTSFALYGFPESHAISFAHLAYSTAYLKAHRAPEFYASLLNNQPMGFYSPATIVKDGKRHRLKFRPVCAEKSDWLCTIGKDDSIRLGFCIVRGVNEQNVREMLTERTRTPFASMEDFKWRTSFSKEALRTLAEIGALNVLAKHRRDAMWEVEKEMLNDDLFSLVELKRGNARPHPRGERDLMAAFSQYVTSSNSGRIPFPLPAGEGQGEGENGNQQEDCPLSPMTPSERLHADYAGMELTTGPHPMALLREQCDALKVWPASDLPQAKTGDTIRVAGNVICRQRPGTAKGFVFISLEDETGISNAIVAPKLFEELRLLITQESFLLIEGKLQNSENVIHIRAEKIERLTHGDLAGSASYDFH
ncbi:MAG: dnaE2 [Verrucomicrobiales bacterium]|nr:dnaE2 [Verrucomicrobiales bacterium]